MACRKNHHTLFAHDEKIRTEYPVLAGVDEAGRGPLAGPVVAAAVILRPGSMIKGLRDSKFVAEHERLRLFWEIAGGAENIGIGITDADTIDEINILRATRRAMDAAVRDLHRSPDILLIDAVSLPETAIIQRSIIRGESFSASIAAASIVAKTVRDDIMLAYHREYPHYNFKAHKGYSTREHMEMIRQHGPCPIHRKTFRKVIDMQLPFSFRPENEEADK